MSYNNVKTMMGDYLDIIRSFPDQNTIQFSPIAFSTLNQHFNVQSGITPSVGTIPSINYLVLGRGGLGQIPVSGNDSLPDLRGHNVTDARCFDHLPLYACKLAEDTPAIRDKYRLRTVRTINSESWVVYWALKLNITFADPSIQILESNSPVPTDYVPSASQQTPTPISLDSDGIPITASGKQLLTSTAISFVLSNEEIEAIKEATIALRGDARYANLTEVGIVSGVDSTINSTLGGVPVTHDEVICAQVHTYIRDSKFLPAATDSLDFDFVYGQSSPFYI